MRFEGGAYNCPAAGPSTLTCICLVGALLRPRLGVVDVNILLHRTSAADTTSSRVGCFCVAQLDRLVPTPAWPPVPVESPGIHMWLSRKCCVFIDTTAPPHHICYQLDVLSGTGAATLSSRYNNAVFIEGVGTYLAPYRPS